MKQNQNQRNDAGITLVALIITIIILVILAAVSISAVYNSKIVDYAVNGATDYAGEAVKENEIMSGTESLIDSTVKKIEDILGGKTPPEPEEPLGEQFKDKIGAYVDYKPADTNPTTYSTKQDGAERSGYGTEQTITKDTNLKWRIMNVEGNKITLISETIPSEELKLKGVNGYNNGVKLLNDTCNTLYGNNSLGAIGRSINLEDINGLMGVTEEEKKRINSNYGKEYTPNNKYYPNIFLYEIIGYVNTKYGTKLEQTHQDTWYSGSSQASTLKGRETYYDYRLRNYKEMNTIEFALATGQTGSMGSLSHNTYWFASRRIGYEKNRDYIWYSICDLTADSITGSTMFYSDLITTNTVINSSTVRPCIELDLSKINIGETGTGESTDPYSITVR